LEPCGAAFGAPAVAGPELTGAEPAGPELAGPTLSLAQAARLKAPAAATAVRVTWRIMASPLRFAG
jgi:hypothetical protein